MEQFRSRILEEIASDYINGKITFEAALKKKSAFLESYDMYEDLYEGFEDDSSDDDDGG